MKTTGFSLISSIFLLAGNILIISTVFANEGPKTDPVIMERIKKDWRDAINGGVIPKIDESMSWGGGTLTRIGPGKLEYVNKRNGFFSQILDLNTDILNMV